jgi:hypothetical protein
MLKLEHRDSFKDEQWWWLRFTLLSNNGGPPRTGGKVARTDLAPALRL